MSVFVDFKYNTVLLQWVSIWGIDTSNSDNIKRKQAGRFLLPGDDERGWWLTETTERLLKNVERRDKGLSDETDEVRVEGRDM